MYVPDLSSILRAMNISKEQLNDLNGSRVQISVATLRLLLQYVAQSADFDEATYKRENPDVATAAEAGQIEDLRAHFVQSGFLEERKASDTKFDEAWYVQYYPDVLGAVREGVLKSGAAHFSARGRMEWRAPNAAALPWVRAWAEVQLREGGSAV